MALEKIGSCIKTSLKGFFDKEFFGEFLSTFMLILLGDGSVAQYMLINNEGTREPFLCINFGYGCAVAFGVYLAGGVSGAHMNPAVSVALAVVRKFEWSKVPKYIAGQMLGAFVGALLVFLVYLDRLRDGGDLIEEGKFRGIFATYPHLNTTIEGRLLDQVVGTMILMLLLSALIDKNNTPPPPGVLPLVVGLIVFAIGVSFGTNCGYAINPARDLAPRFLSLVVGYDSTFSADNGYFWIPVIGPIVGGIVGAAAYVFIIEKPACGSCGSEGELVVSNIEDIEQPAAKEIDTAN